MKNIRNFLQTIFTLLLLGIYIYFSFLRYNLSLVRYFDADEFAHLWWGSHFVMGLKPYVDFLYFFPPGFLWFLSPLFIFGSGTAPLTGGRVLMFVTFLMTTIGSGMLFYRLRKSMWGALLAMVILAFLPMPFDKFLEIRPDNPATMIALWGMVCQTLFFQKRKRIWAMLTGFMYAISLILLPKMLPGIALAVAIFVIGEIVENHKEIEQKESVLIRKITFLIKKGIIPFLLGGLVPSILTFLYLLSLGSLDTVWYSLTKLPLEANQISKVFIMMPDLFFYPNETFYGQYGWSRGLLTNHAFWLFGLCIAVFRLATPLFPNGRKGMWNELLVGCMLFINAATYVAYIPLKHTQYLIPIAVFIAWYNADGVLLIWKKVQHTMIGMVLFTLAFVYLLFQMNVIYHFVNDRKFGWTNRQTYAELDGIFISIPKDEYILDLDGRTMYYKSPYYACCIPFGQFGSFLSRKLPPLYDALEKTQTKYIYQGQLERISTLEWNDRGFIGNQYEPWNGKKEIWMRK